MDMNGIEQDPTIKTQILNSSLVSNTQELGK
jgi:hypothetical protein